MSIVDFLKAFPALFAVLGLLVGGTIMLWVTKKFGPMQNTALQQVVKTYEKQVDALNKLAETQFAAHQVALQMQKDHWAEELGKMEKSRDQYKQDLHTVRGELGTENTNLKLKNQELEMRPSVEVIQVEQQTFYREMLDTMKSIGTELKTHDQSIDARMQPLYTACNATADGMKALVKALTKTGHVRTDRRKTKTVNT